MAKTKQIKGCHGLKKLGTHVVDIHKPPQYVLIDCISMQDSFASERDLVTPKNITFCCCFHKYPWMKPARMASPYYKAQFCLSVLTPLKLLEVQELNSAQLIITPT